MFFHCLTCSDSHGDVNDVDDVECLQCQDDFVLADDGTACLGRLLSTRCRPTARSVVGLRL